MLLTENSSINQVIDGYMTVHEEHKTKLIQQATHRLRHKLLESKYQQLLSDIVELQSQLDIIKLETSISFTSLDGNHLNHFENKLKYHQLQVQTMFVQQQETMYGIQLPVTANIDVTTVKQQHIDSESSSCSSLYSSNSESIGYEEEDKEDIHLQRTDSAVAMTTTDTNSRCYSYPSDICTIATMTNTLKRNATLYYIHHLSSYSLHDILDNPHNSKKECFIEKLISNSWKWTRFMLIMMLAIIIYVKRYLLVSPAY